MPRVPRSVLCLLSVALAFCLGALGMVVSLRQYEAYQVDALAISALETRRSGDVTSAKLLYHGVVARAPDECAAYKALGELSMEDGQRRDARKMFELALSCLTAKSSKSNSPQVEIDLRSVEMALGNL